jgi:hypothetical protein
MLMEIVTKRSFPTDKDDDNEKQSKGETIDDELTIEENFEEKYCHGRLQTR